MGKRPDETFVIFYREDFQEYLADNPGTLVCLSESSRQIILSLLRFASWPTRWRIDLQDHSRRVTGDVWEEVQQWGELAQKEVLFDMSCDINESLDQVNTTLEGISGWLEQLTGITALIEQVTSIITQLGDLAALATIAVNTGNINTALGGLELSPTTNVNVTNNHPITVSGGGSCSPNCAPGGGSFTPPDASEGQTEPGEGPGGFTPPTTWTGTTEEYDAYKCKAATFLVDSYLAYVRNYSLFASLGIPTITATIFFTPMPDKFMALISPVLAFALFAYILTVVLSGEVLAAYLGLYHSNLSAVRDQVICDLYNAPSVADARQVITDWMTEQLPAGLGSVPGFVDYHVSSLFTNEVLNILFEEYAALADEAEGDCTECGDECPDIQIYSTPEDGPRGILTGGPVDFQAEGTRIGTPPYPDYYLEIVVNNTPGTWEHCDGPKAIRITNLVGYTPGGGTSNVYIWTRDGMEGDALYYQGHTVYPCITNCGRYYIRSATPFTCDINVSDNICT